jgi:hypothetical protein
MSANDKTLYSVRDIENNIKTHADNKVPVFKRLIGLQLNIH